MKFCEPDSRWKGLWADGLCVGEIRIIDQICSSDLADWEVVKLVCSNTDISCEQIRVGSWLLTRFGRRDFCVG